MAEESIDQRVERLMKETGGTPSPSGKAASLEDVQKELDQDFDYQMSSGPDRVVKRKEAYAKYGLTPPTTIASPGSTELDTHGPVHTFIRPTLEGLGLVGGAALGSPMGPMGSVAGGALGFAGGDALSSHLERLVGERPPMRSPEQALVETGKALTGGTATEMTGQVVGKVAGGLLAKAGAPFKSQYEGANRTLDDIAKERGITLDPHEVLQSRPLALGHKVLESIPFTSGMIQRKEKEKLVALTAEWNRLQDQTGAKDRARIGEIGQRIQDTVDKELDRIGARQEDIRNQARDSILQDLGSPLTFKELGDQSQQALKEHHAGLKAIEDAAWEYAREAIPTDKRVMTTTLPQVAQTIKKEYENIPSFLDEPLLRQLGDVAGSGNKTYDTLMASAKQQIPEGLPPAIRQKITAELVGNEQPGWRVEDLMKLRSELSSAIQAHHTGLQRGDIQKGSADAYGRVYTRLLKAVDEDLSTFAKSTGSDFADRLALARTASGQRLSFFNPKDNPSVMKAINADPSRLASTLIQPGSASGYTSLKEIAGGRATEPVKKAFTNTLFDVGGKEEQGLAGLRSKLDRYGVQTLSEVYSPSELKNLYALADRAKWSQQSPIGNPFFRELVKTAPKQVAPTILEHPDLTSKVLRQFPTMKQDLRSAFVEGLKPDKQSLFPTQLLKQLNAYPPEVQKQLFSPKELEDFYNLAKIVERAKSTVAMAANPSGTSQGVVAFTTSGMMLRHPIGMAPTVLGTSALSKLYLSGLGRKYLLEGLLEPATTVKGAYLTAQIMGIAGMDLTRDQRERHRLQMGIPRDAPHTLETQP